MKPLKIDGLSSNDLSKVRSAIRQVWHRSIPRRLCVARAQDKDGYPICEQCNQRTPKNFIDHIIPAGDVLSTGYIKRLFVPSSGLQALCKECHKAKTKKERGKNVAAKKNKAA